MYTDEYFMRLALKEAKQALEEEEIPIGAIVVQDNKILARGHNMTEKLNDATAHAEIIALTAAFSNMGSKYLPDATLYVRSEERRVGKEGACRCWECYYKKSVIWKHCDSDSIVYEELG